MNKNSQNEYANILQKIDLPNASQMLDAMSNETKQMLMYNTRQRILNELSVLDNNFWMLVETNHTPPFDKQIACIKELYEYGFYPEAQLCLDIMQSRIDEMFPHIKEWFNIQKQGFVFKPALIKGVPLKGPIFLEQYFINKDIIQANWCFLGCQDDKNTKWTSCAFSLPELVMYMEINGYQYLWEDMPSPLTDAYLDMSTKTKLASFIQENIEKLIKEYIQEGFQTIEL